MVGKIEKKGVLEEAKRIGGKKKGVGGNQPPPPPLLSLS